MLLVLDVHILTLGGQEHRIRWKFFHFFVFRSIRTTRLLSSCFVFSSRVPPARTLAKRSVKCLSVCRIFFGARHRHLRCPNIFGHTFASKHQLAFLTAGGSWKNRQTIHVESHQTVCLDGLAKPASRRSACPSNIDTSSTMSVLMRHH